ncbi:membrane protein [Beggiatoa sp. PS]|nr:membrane protein [Beggiatoa sp. PS]
MKIHSKNTLTESEYFLFFSLIIGFSLFCHLLTLFLSSNGSISEPEEFYIYSLFFSIGPIVTYVSYRLIATQLTAIRQVFFFVNGYLTLLFIILLLIFILNEKEINPNFVYFYSFLQIFLSSSIFVFAKLISHWNNRTINIGNQWFVIVFPVILVFFLLSDYQMAMINAAFKSSSFQLGLVLGLFLCAFIFIFQRFSQHPNFLIKNTLNILSKIFLVLTIIHIPLFFLEFSYLIPQLSLIFLDHHIPYTGPAYAILGGKIPLVDAFSQYGMFAFLPYTLAFAFLTPSILTAGIVTAILNILQNLVFFLILNKTVANKFLVYFGTLLVLVLYYAIAPLERSVPSTYGARFLWPFLLILAILYLPNNKLFSIWTVFAALLCAFFSAELFVWGIATYLTYAVIFCLTHNKDKKLYDLPKNIFLVLITFFIRSHHLFNHYFWAIWQFAKVRHLSRVYNGTYFSSTSTSQSINL